MKKMGSQATIIRTAIAKIKRLEIDIENDRVNHGVKLNDNQYTEIFNRESNEFFNESQAVTCSKNELCKLLWKNSMEAALDAKEKGKRTVRFTPIMIRFGIILQMKLKNGLYELFERHSIFLVQDYYRDIIPKMHLLLMVLCLKRSKR